MGRTSKATVLHTTHKCCNCKKDYDETEFYSSESEFFKGDNKIPYCKNCIDELFTSYIEKYESEDCSYPEKKTVRRICMAFNIYYSDKVFESAIKATEKMPNMSIISSYLKIVHLVQYKRKSYDTTIYEEAKDGVIESYADIKDTKRVKQKTVRFFGTGFSDDDYEFLQEQYDDWTARHECKTKAQEEIFKQICFTQLELLKATRAKQDTKDLTATFQKLLETAKLQPKQNTKDVMSDSQVFGTLIDKWETTRPLPEVDEQLRDIDNIGNYINIFFKGHLAKMMGIKNGLSNTYEKFMKKHTVTKPEYDGDSNSEALFDAIFGGGNLDEQ